MIVANNARSRIEFLLSTPNPAGEAAEPAEKGEANGLPDDKRMRRKSLTVNREVVSLQSGDFNGDGKTDLAYYGTPAELVILINQGGGEFAEARKINAGEGIESAGALAAGDFNRDGKDDLALATSTDVVFLFQLADGKLGEPERSAHTSNNPRMVKAVDIDGDGGHDLVMLEGGNDDPIRIRFSAPGGTLGPEQRFAIEPLRAYAFGQVDGKPGQELLTIEAQSGRGRVMTLADADARTTRVSAAAGPVKANRVAPAIRVARTRDCLTEDICFSRAAVLQPVYQIEERFVIRVPLCDVPDRRKSALVIRH